jgi:hypothetical protein
VPRLGTTFSVSARPELKSAAGKPIGAGFRAQFATPQFGVTYSDSGSHDLENVAPNVEVKLAFNLAIEAKAAAALCQFIDAAGRKVPAQVRHATGDDYFSIRPGAGDWQERWRLAREPAKAEPDSDNDEDRAAARTQPQLERLVITPAAPLPAGGPWRFEMAAGIASADGAHRTTKPLILALGTVRPFAITSVQPQSYINSGRSISVSFSHALAPDITSDTAAKYFRITPPVANLRFEETWEAFTIRGDFALGQEYQLQVDPSLISATGAAYEGERVHTLQFAPVKPRLYLPEITWPSARRRHSRAGDPLRKSAVAPRHRAPRRAAGSPRRHPGLQRVCRSRRERRRDVQADPAGANPQPRRRGEDLPDRGG